MSLANKDGKGKKHFNIGGKRPVMEALMCGWPVLKLFIRKEPHSTELWDFSKKAGARGIPVSYIEPREYDKRYSRHSQGVCAVVRGVEFITPPEILEKVKKKGESPLFLALDGIQDPQNIGAIIRTALAMGVHAVVVPRKRTAPLGEGAAKSSAGAIFQQPVCEVSNINQFIKWAQNNGMWIYGLDMAGENTIWETDMTGPMVLVLGGEGKGLSRLVGEHCDFGFIPMTEL